MGVPFLSLVSSPVDSDEALLLAMGRGERSAFRALASRHVASIVQFCRRSIGDASTAEDLAQDVLVALWEARARFRGGDASAWIYTFALNRCRKHGRGWRRWLRTSDRLTHSDVASDMEEALEAQVLSVAVEGAISKLPVGQREALLLRYAAQLDYRGIGQALACSEEAARARVFEGLKKLRTTLGVSR